MSFIYNGQMLEDENNLKDPEGKSLTSYGAGTKNMSVSISYTKSSKLITALFMVTDIMDKDEPLRNKLRTLGAEVISDVHSDPIKVAPKIGEIMSFLDVALAINLISEMNCNILKGEFFKLAESVKEYNQIKSTWLENFLSHSSDPSQTKLPSTRIGVQKGSTLMNALRGVNSSNVSNKVAQNFDVLKKHRRADIVTVLNTAGVALTITDIKDKAKGHPDKLSALVSCGEKTLQRELVSMLKDGVLKKEGEKRWSRYSIN